MEKQIYGHTGIGSARRAGDPEGNKDKGTGLGAGELRGNCFANKPGSGLNSPEGSSMEGRGVRFGIRVDAFDEKEEALNAKVVDIVFNTKSAPRGFKFQDAVDSYRCRDGLMTDDDMAVTVVKNEPLGRTLIPPLRSITPVKDVHPPSPPANDKLATPPAKDKLVRYRSGSLAPSCATSGRKPRQARLRLKTSEYKVLKSAALQLAPPSHARLGARLTAKQLGVDPIVWQGLFSIPTVAVSKDDNVNCMILDLVHIYNNISAVLMAKHVSVLFAKIKGRTDNIEDKSLKSLVCGMRTAAYKLRRDIASLGGTLLNEPRHYWVQKYFLAKF